MIEFDVQGPSSTLCRTSLLPQSVSKTCKRRGNALFSHILAFRTSKRQKSFFLYIFNDVRSTALLRSVASFFFFPTSTMKSRTFSRDDFENRDMVGARSSSSRHKVHDFDADRFCLGTVIIMTIKGREETHEYVASAPY